MQNGPKLGQPQVEMVAVAKAAKAAVAKAKVASLKAVSLKLVKAKVVVEANYKNPCLQERCAAEGVTYISGMEWLAGQAIGGYQLMTGIQPDAERVKACCAV